MDSGFYREMLTQGEVMFGALCIGGLALLILIWMYKNIDK